MKVLAIFIIQVFFYTGIILVLLKNKMNFFNISFKEKKKALMSKNGRIIIILYIVGVYISVISTLLSLYYFPDTNKIISEPSNWRIYSIILITCFSLSLLAIIISIARFIFNKINQDKY